MTLKDTIKADVTAALKSGDKFRKDTLRLALSEIEKAEKGGKTAVIFTDEQVQSLLQTIVKQRLFSASEYRKGGVEARALEEEAEAKLLGEYLPTQLSDAELEVIVSEVLANVASGTNFGLAMKSVMARVGKGADGKRVSAILKRHLA